jgi:calcium-dependent protein kinase
MEEKNFLSKKTKRKNDKNIPKYTKQDELKYNEKNQLLEKEKKLKEKNKITKEEKEEKNNEKNEEEDANNNKKKADTLKLKKQLSNIAEVNDFVSNENNPNYERSSESGDSKNSEKNKEKNKKNILDKDLIKEEEGESKLDESEETVRENFQPMPQDMEPGKLGESLKNILQENSGEDNIDIYMNKLMNPAKPANAQGENLINLDEVEIINNNDKKEDKKEEKKEELIKNGSLGSIKEESQKKELISSSNKASGEKNKEKEEEKQSVKVDNIKNNQSESILIEDDKEKENSDKKEGSDKKAKELVESQKIVQAENPDDKDKLESININSKNMSKQMGDKLEQMNKNENKLTFEQMNNMNNFINIKDTDEKKSDTKNEEKKENNEKENNNSIKANNKDDAKKSLENKISLHKEIENNSKQQNSGDKIRQSKSNKLINSINDKIKEEEKKENEKEDKKGKKEKEEENVGYSKNFKTMKVPKKNQNHDKERKSLTPFGDTPMGDPAPKMKVSKESMIKISTEPVANFYSIVKDLGHGSYGQVKKVKHKELNEIRAMKITNKKSESSKYEIEILKKISHPNITKIFEIFADSKKYYIIMEFLEGGELFEAITNIGSFTENSACKVMKQILSAVLYLHSNHIVHRDLKPENIMLTQKPKNGNYQIKLIDFGTAKIFRPGKKMNKFIGTSYYIAPEVLKERYDEKCDVWSCGVILFILLCGYPPFNGNTNVDIFHAIQNQNPIFGGEEWEDITSEAKDLIKLMLKKNPSERLSAEQCLTHKWFKIMESSERNKTQKISKQIQLNAIQHMAQFVHENRFKQAVLQFISTQFNIQKEENELKELFKSMDVTGTGQLTKDEFTKKLMELYGENDGKEMANSIFNSLDMDGSGKISYDEFLSAMINSQKVVTEERLKKAFKMFDKDNSGKLSVKEIRNVFGGTEAQWKQVINEVDLNNDGEVDFEEFKIMMVNMDKNQIIERKKSSEKSKGVSEVD